MKQVIPSRIMAAVLMVLGMLMGVLTPSPQEAQAQVIQRSFTFFNNSHRSTALDLHIRFTTTVTEVVDPDGQVPFRDPDGNLQVSGLGSNTLYFWGNPGVPARDDVTITFRFGGSNPRVSSSYFTYHGLPPGKWASDGNILEAEGLLSQALKAARNEKLRERLKGLGPTPLSKLDTLMDKDVPGQIDELAKVAKDSGDPAADFLAKVAAIVAKMIVKADVTEAVTASPDPGKIAGPVSPQPAPAPTATHDGVEPGRGQTVQGPSISAPAVEIGKLIAEVLEKVGKDGVITVEESRVVRYEPPTVSVRSTDEGGKRGLSSTANILDVLTWCVHAGEELDVWSDKVDRERYRILNDKDSAMPIDVYVDGEPVTTLQPGQGRDFKGKKITVIGHGQVVPPDFIGPVPCATVHWDALP